MVIRRTSFVVLALGAASAGGLADEPRAPDTILVPGDFKTIQGAVNASYPGDSIVVTHGTYRENVVVAGLQHTGLQIYANGDATIEGKSDAPAIRIDGVSGVGVHGFVVRSKGDGVVVTDSNYVYVDGSRVVDVPGDGIRVENSGSVTVSTNVVDVAGGAGIRVVDSGGVTVQANDVGGVTESGVVVRGGGGMNVCSNSVGGAGEDGVTVSHTTDIVLDENAVHDVGDAGLDVSDAANVYIGGNLIGDGGGATPVAGDGIRVDSTERLQMHGNTVEGPLGDGLDVSVPGAEIWMTTVVNAGGDGIRLGEGAVGATVSDSSIDEVDGSGIVVLADGVAVETNSIQDAGEDGVTVEGGNAYVHGNDVESPGHDGLCLFNAPGDAPVSVQGNHVWSAGEDGMDLGETCGAHVVQNTVLGAGKNGIEIGAGEANVLRQNKAKKSGGFDLFEGDAANANRIDRSNKFKRTHRRGKHRHH